MHIHRGLTTALLVIAAAFAPAAMTTAAESKPAFVSVDTNGDGKISMKEAKAVGVPEAEFREDDLDNNQRLSKRDWKYVDMQVEKNSS